MKKKNTNPMVFIMPIMVIVPIIIFIVLFIIAIFRFGGWSDLYKVTDVVYHDDRITNIDYDYCDKNDVLDCYEKAEIYGKNNQHLMSVIDYKNDKVANKNVDYYNKLLEIYEDYDHSTLVFAKEADTVKFTKAEKVYSNGRFVFYLYVDDSYNDIVEKITNTMIDYPSQNIDVSDDELNRVFEENINNEKNKVDKLKQDGYNAIVLEKYQLIKYIDDKGEDYNDDDIMEIQLLSNKIRNCDEFKDIVKELDDKIVELKEYPNEVKKEVNDLFKKAEKSLSKKDYDALRERIDELNKLHNKYYKDLIVGWEEKMDKLDTKVFMKSCKKYNYKKLLRNPMDYYDEPAYFFGEVVQVVSDYEYRVGVDCHKYHYIKGYYCDNYIYMTYFGEESLIEDDMIYIYGTMDGNMSYTSVLGNTITVPKISARYVKIK